MTASLNQAKQNPDIASDFTVPESLETLPSSDPTIVEKIQVIETESENQKLSSTFEVVVAQPITFEVAISELGGNREEIEQEEIEKWAEEKLRSFLRDMILRLGLNYKECFLRDRLIEFRKKYFFALSRFGYSEACRIRW